MPPQPAPGIPTCCVKLKDGADRIRPKETQREGGDLSHPTAPPPALGQPPRGHRARGSLAAPAERAAPRPARPRSGRPSGRPGPRRKFSGAGPDCAAASHRDKRARSSAATHLGGREGGSRDTFRLNPPSPPSHPRPCWTGSRWGPGLDHPAQPRQGSAPRRRTKRGTAVLPPPPRLSPLSVTFWCLPSIPAGRPRARAGRGERRCARSGTRTSGQRAWGCRQGESAAGRCRRVGGPRHGPAARCLSQGVPVAERPGACVGVRSTRGGLESLCAPWVPEAPALRTLPTKPERCPQCCLLYFLFSFWLVCLLLCWFSWVVGSFFLFVLVWCGFFCLSNKWNLGKVTRKW